ncbi:tyrosine-protein kinase transmembrane receptor Ror [Episyrphus balteatus]|uniref:tyrosine-protein kinase transmembrane receptor Ror n=1 Tax=Episyrphus balteatus TaxID=286459 RepID=UPI0024852F52|nr:tyrosine-protein kinase transmembrane receptor Ror [Episyrphus balteatus]
MFVQQMLSYIAVFVIAGYYQDKPFLMLVKASSAAIDVAASSSKDNFNENKSKELGISANRQSNGFIADQEAHLDSGNEEIPIGICQVYNGTTCEKYLKNETVFIPPNLTLNELEERLKAAYGVIKESKDMNQNCRIYALPSLCYSTLPICRTPERTNLLYFSNRATHKERNKSSKKNHHQIHNESSIGNHIIDRRRKRFLEKNTKERKLFLKRKSTIAYDDIFTGEISSQYPPTRESENLRRICRDECELLENELCQKEYAIAKRHPTIGQKLPLEECQSLPHASDCSSFGIAIDVNPEEHCYWGYGSEYRGTLAVSASGKPCLRWSWLMKEISDYPELAGQNYCRNPGVTEEKPWCFVDDKSFEKIIEHCNIRKCADELWFYIYLSIATIICILLLYAGIVYYKKHMNDGMTNIQNINTPNADKNIYGNSQMNSSLEMARLYGGNENSSFAQNLDRSSLLRVSQYTLQDVEFVEEIGEGAFGKVYKGQLTQPTGEKIFVAVKALKENASLKTQQDFRREIELISDLKHDNIVCILGVVLNKEPFCMLFEYMSQGDLHEFLIANSPTESKCLSQLEFLHIALQISEGMEYLSGHHYVHRDLAARNCLVGEDLTVKISDFGLSRDIYSSDYYRVQSKSLLPVRWMPSESILYGKFTTESDVWSFGVVLWEIYSYGMQPYYGHSNQEVINMVRSRQLLACPEACPTAVYSLMIECWHEQSVRRPSFSEISHRLKVWHQAQKKLICPSQMTQSFHSNNSTLAMN